jgi:uncharacterized Zn-binding protein involved in type VI secretion
MSEEVLRAARLGDEITHGMGMVGLVAGALIGAVVGAAIVAAGIATGGLAIMVIVGGCIAAGGLSGAALARGIMRAANLSGPTSGTLGQGSPNVNVNGMAAMRAGVDFAPSCSGLPLNHLPKPNVLIAEGAQKVTVNGKPMARTGMRMECGAKIKTGSSNVFVGGPSIQMVEIHDNEATAEMLLGVLGTAALLGAGLGAALAGALPFMAFGGFTLAAHFGFGALHEWGESLGPGYGDIMVGVGGFALLGLGARGARTPAGRNAVDVLNRVEADPQAVGSNFGNLRLRPRLGSNEAAEEAAEQSLGDQAQNIYDRLPARLKSKTVATDGEENTLSGYSDNKPEGFTHVDADRVIARSEEIGHDLQRAGAMDQGKPGQYSASHAEKQSAVNNPETDSYGVSRPMCRDCQRWFSREAIFRGRDVRVEDPDMVRIFKPDGEVDEFPVLDE